MIEYFNLKINEYDFLSSAIKDLKTQSEEKEEKDKEQYGMLTNTLNQIQDKIPTLEEDLKQSASEKLKIPKELSVSHFSRCYLLSLILSWTISCST